MLSTAVTPKFRDDELAASLDRYSRGTAEEAPGAHDGLLAGERIDSDNLPGVSVRDNELASRIDGDAPRIHEHTA